VAISMDSRYRPVSLVREGVRAGAFIMPTTLESLPIMNVVPSVLTCLGYSFHSCSSTVLSHQRLAHRPGQSRQSDSSTSGMPSSVCGYVTQWHAFLCLWLSYTAGRQSHDARERRFHVPRRESPHRQQSTWDYTVLRAHRPVLIAWGSVLGSLGKCKAADADSKRVPLLKPEDWRDASRSCKKTRSQQMANRQQLCGSPLRLHCCTLQLVSSAIWRRFGTLKEGK